MEWHEVLWAFVYKGVEVKRVNGNTSIFLCVREKEEKSWNIETNETNSSLKTLNKKYNKKVVLKHLTKGN